MTTATQKIVEDIQSFGNEVTRLNGEIERIQAVLKRPGTPANDNTPAGVDAAALAAERNVLAAFGRKGESGSLGEFYASMEGGSDPDGGYAVLEQMSSTMTTKLYDDVTIRRLARVVTITSGSEFVEPIDKDEIESGWTSEKGSRPETDAAQLAMLKIPLREVYAMPRATQNLLDDASFDIGGWLERKITDKFGRDENTAFVSGAGVDRPRGFLTYDTATTDDDTRAWNVIQHVVSGAAATVTADGLRNLYWSLRAPYRRNATWVMSSATANQIDKLKSGDGEYLWRDGMNAGAPPTLLGLPVSFDEEMPATEAGALPIALADWQRAYTIVDRPGIKMLRDPYTARPFVNFYSTKRVGGALSNSEAIKLLKIAAS